MVILSLGRGDALRIPAAILRAEQAEINIALLDLVQIDRLCGPVSGRRLLKKEHLEEITEQRILSNVLRKRLALFCKLRLNGRDENPVLHSPDTRQWNAAEVLRTTYIQQLKLYHKARWRKQVEMEKDIRVTGRAVSGDASLGVT